MFTLIMYQERDGRWFFDDLSRNIKREEMVCGADSLLSMAAKGMRVLPIVFSTEPLDNPVAVLEHLRSGLDDEADGVGNWYRDALTGSEAWLCPTLLAYYDPAPKTIHVALAPDVDDGIEDRIDTARLLIVGFDPSFTPEMRLFSIEASEELLEVWENDAFARIHMFGIRLPDDADLTGAIRMAADAGAVRTVTFYESLTRCVPLAESPVPA